MKKKQAVDFRSDARNLIKSAIASRGLNYEQVAEMLTAIGVEETRDTIAQKLSRGSFALSWTLAVFSVLNKSITTQDN